MTAIIINQLALLVHNIYFPPAILINQIALLVHSISYPHLTCTVVVKREKIPSLENVHFT